MRTSIQDYIKSVRHSLAIIEQLTDVDCRPNATLEYKLRRVDAAAAEAAAVVAVVVSTPDTGKQEHVTL